MLTLFTIAIMILFTKCLLWGTIRAAARDWVLGQITNIHTIQIQATRPPPSRRRRHVMERGVLKLDLILSHNQHHHQCTTDCMLKGAYHQSILKSQVNVARRCPLWSGPGSGCLLLLLPASVPGPAELLLPQPGRVIVTLSLTCTTTIYIIFRIATTIYTISITTIFWSVLRGLRVRPAL